MSLQNGDPMTGMGGTPGRVSVALVLAALIGAVAFTLLVDTVTPAASVDLRLSRSEIMERGRAYMEALGYPVGTLQQDATFAFAGDTQLFLQERVGMRDANSMLRADSLAAHVWEVTWYDRALTRSQNIEQYAAWVSPSGRVLGHDHSVPDTLPRASATPAEAREIAERFLRGQGIDVSQYLLQSSSDITRPQRVDYRFVWSKNGTGAEETVWVRIQGREVGGFRQTYEPGGGFADTFTGRATTWTFLFTASFAVIFLLFFFIVVLFLKKYHEGEVGTGTGLMVLLGVFAMMVLSSINEYASLGASARIGDLNAFNVRIVLFIFNAFILQLFLGVMVFAAWSVGESSARTVWPEKLRGADAALHRAFLTRELGGGILRGYLWGLIILGGYGLALYILQQAGVVRTLVTGLTSFPESHVHFLHPIVNAVGLAAVSEVIFRLFFLSYLKEHFRTTWPGVIVSVALWTATSLGLWVIPYGTLSIAHSAVVMVLLGLAFTALFLRYDLVTSYAANFVVLALYLAVPLFTSTSDDAAFGRAAFLVLLGIPLILGVVGVARGRRFDFTPTSLPAHIRRISERVRMAKELEIARSVQMSLLPKSDPRIPGYDIAGICVPALEVGGDYFDFISLGDRKIGIAVGDVSGKGVPAAIYMTLTKGILQSHAEDAVSPRAVLSKVNNLMYRTIERNSFVSMLYAVLDPPARTMRFARAGQCPLILSQREGGAGTVLSPKGMALGLEVGKVFDAVLEEQEVTLKPGETLVFYTDGFTEAMDGDDREYGEERLEASIARYHNLPAADMIRKLCDDVRQFTGGRPQHDDMTLVIVKVV
ncbi:MAG: rsbU [Bacteroidetes bacterium]|nr:rsbU [Bacteroidota bacterium]